MNPDLDRLQPYPFEKLAQLKQGCQPPADLPHIVLSIGEPQHPAPEFVKQVLCEQLSGLSKYPTTAGLPELRQSIAQWLQRRFSLPSLPDADSQVLPVNGTREALFAFAQAVIDRRRHPLVISPNPFYQIYEGAALLAGAKPYFLNCRAETGFLPDFEQVTDEAWRHCQLLYLCTPGNPTGAVADLASLQRLIELAERHDFIIASDECYSEIYFDEEQPPPGLLQAAAAMGNTEFQRCVVFHSLSKRSNLPGLRSGFVAGDAAVLKQFLRYRTYHGCAMPVQHQLASAAAWNDEDHVRRNRDSYRAKFDAVLEILGPRLQLTRPDAGFYLWPATPIDDEQFAQRLFAEQHVTVLPGRYLARTAQGVNPGAGHVRMALVATETECLQAAQRIATVLDSL